MLKHGLLDKYIETDINRASRSDEKDAMNTQESYASVWDANYCLHQTKTPCSKGSGPSLWNHTAQNE